jgi:hypothetical protein
MLRTEEFAATSFVPRLPSTALPFHPVIRADTRGRRSFSSIIEQNRN